MQVELYTEQIYEDHNQSEKLLYQGNISTAQRGSILEFWNSDNKYKMTILENKILLKTNNQTRIFELGRTTSSILQTEYGNMNMNITTHQIEITKQKEQISKIRLEYDIEIQETMKYLNIIEIKITRS